MEIGLQELAPDGTAITEPPRHQGPMTAATQRTHGERRRQAEYQAQLTRTVRQQVWFRTVVGLYGQLSGMSFEGAQSRIEDVLVPFYIQLQGINLLPDEQAVRDVFSVSSSWGVVPTSSRTKQGVIGKYQAIERREWERRYVNDVYTRMLPLSISCSSLTAFILPLYDGRLVYVLRWVMIVVCAFIGPRLKNGFYPLLGVLIFGMMVNRPLALCTFCLGMWAAVTLATVIAKAIGFEWD